MPRELQTILCCLAGCLTCAGLGNSTTLTTSGSTGIAAYTTWEALLTGTPRDVSVPAGSDSYNTGSGFSMGSGAVSFTVVGVDPQQTGGYYLSLSGNALSDGSASGSQMDISLNQGETGLLFQVQNNPDVTQTLSLTLSNGAVLTIPGSVTYFGVASSTPLVWADIISYSGQVVLRDISFGNANPADFAQDVDEHGTAGLVATGIAILSRAVQTRLSRLRRDTHIGPD